jgi:hypothetical protein
MLIKHPLNESNLPCHRPNALKLTYVEVKIKRFSGVVPLDLRLLIGEGKRGEGKGSREDGVGVASAWKFFGNKRLSR